MSQTDLTLGKLPDRVMHNAEHATNRHSQLPSIFAIARLLSFKRLEARMTMT